MATRAQIDIAYAELAEAVDKFKDAIMEFRRVYDPSTVDLLTWMSGLDDTMFEIDEDIEVELERN